MTGKYKVGDKVVPINKTAGDIKLSESGCWNRAIKIKQPFLYIKSIDSKGFHYCSEENKDPIRADWFTEEDLIPYIEPKQNTQMKNNKNTLKVTGPASLIKAFAEELDKLEYRKDTMHESNNICLVTYDEGSYKILHTGGINSYGRGSETSIHLPNDWEKGLQLAVEEEQKEFKVGDYVTSILQKQTGDVKAGEIIRIYAIDNGGWLGFNKYRMTGGSINHHNPINFKKVTKEDYLQYQIKLSGLKVGDLLSEGLLDAWINKDKNEYDESRGGWKEPITRCGGGNEVNRKIVKFEVKEGRAAALISNTSILYVSIEGIADFIKEYKQKVEKTITIGSYKSDYSEHGMVKFGCQSFTHDDVKSYIKLLEIPGKSSITIEGTEITKEMLNKILDNIK